MEMHVTLLLCSLVLVLSASERRTTYLLYTVKSGEGFNLRRDVHMRAATLVRLLQEEEEEEGRRAGSTTSRDWVLVLPPWPQLYHWQSTPRSRSTFLPWGKFFDLPSLNQFVPTIEFDDYLKQNGRKIDEVMVLQKFKGEFTVDDFDRIEEASCLDEQYRYKKVGEGWEGHVFGERGVVIKIHHCFSAMGYISLIKSRLKKMEGNSILVENFESLLHQRFGDINYWQSRYSMAYAKHLRAAGNQFMRETLGYEANEAGTGREPAREGGGDYLAVHLRRKDYLYAHKNVVPSLEGAAHQLNTLKSELGLDKVFLSSDAPLEERQELKRMVDGLVWYTPTDEEKRLYGDGGVAIIDQWVSAHARHFIGTTHSTFTFRIQEDRQFLGFSKESTFNDVCGPSHNESDPHSCPKPSYWKWEGGPPTPLLLKNTAAAQSGEENFDRQEL